MNIPSILVVDDDQRICRLLKRYLRAEGYEVLTASTGQEMRGILAGGVPDLIILDLMFPGEDGFTLVREVRGRYDVPVIMLTGRSDTVDKVVGLEMGADDYITKPFEDRELLARVRTVLRRSGQRPIVEDADSRECACFEGWELDVARRRLKSPAGVAVHLTSYEFQVLSNFVSRPNRVLSRDEVLDAVAGRGWTPYDRSVDVLVGKLRRKIEKDPRHPEIIKTVRGAGYEFTAQVEFR